MSDSFIGFSDLEDDLELAGRPAKESKTYPCMHCAGTGIWTSYTGRKSGSCHACHGRGYFLTSPDQRRKAKAQRTSAKNKKRHEWIGAHEELYKFLCSASEWSEFADSLKRRVQAGKDLSDKQMAAAKKMMATVLAKRAAKDEQRKAEEAAAPTVDLTKIHELFANAKGAGLKRPKLRIDGYTISLAPANGANAGHLYVKERGQYLGKVTPEGRLATAYDANEHRASIEEALKRFAADPMAEAKAYGQRTGECCCCGKELTNPESIKLGIGPICAGKWGI
jgi:hypothetical protein